MWDKTRLFVRHGPCLSKCCSKVCCSLLQCFAVHIFVWQCVAVRCSVLRSVAECCSVLRCVAVHLYDSWLQKRCCLYVEVGHMSGLIYMWDIMYSYVGYGSLICGTWLIWGKSPNSFRLFNHHPEPTPPPPTYPYQSAFGAKWGDTEVRSVVIGCTSKTRVFAADAPLATHHIIGRHVRHDSFVCVTWHICTCDMTYLFVWHDSFVLGTWLIDKCNMTHAYMCVTWLIHMCDMTHSYVWHDSFIYVTWRIHMCGMTHSYMWHEPFICVAWLIHICGMTHSYVCHDLFIYDSFIRVTWLIRVRDVAHSYRVATRWALAL